jgi:hypothetical protein
MAQSSDGLSRIGLAVEQVQIVEVPEGAFTDLLAARKLNGEYEHFFPSEMQVRSCDTKNPIVPVRISHDPTGTYWGWWDAKHQHFTMIYPRKMLAEMCFTYGSAAEEKRGRGRLVSLRVEPR